MTLSGATRQVTVTANTLTVNGVIGDGTSTFGLTKAGGGTLVLGGNNTYKGVTTVSAGTMSVATVNNASANGPLGNSANAVVLGGSGTSGTLEYTGNTATRTKTFTMGAGGGVLQIDTSGQTLTLSGLIGGTGGLTKSGSGTLSLTGGNNYGGTTTINAGTLTVNGTAIPNGSAVTLANIAGATLNLAGAETIGSLAGGGGSGGNVTLSTFTLTAGGDNTSTAYGGVISGTGGLAKSGTGTLTLSGNNTYSGATTVSAGALNIQHANALGGTGSGTTVSSGAALQIQGGITTAAEPLTLNGTGVSNDGALRNISGNNTFSGAVSLGSNSRINSDSGTLTLSGNIARSGATSRALTIGGAGGVTVNGVIQNTITTVTKDGLGTLTVNAVNQYTGGTTLTGGTIKLGIANALPNHGLTMAGSTVLDDNNILNTTSIGALSLGSTSATLQLHSDGAHGKLIFDSLTVTTGVLTIDEWTGSNGTAGTDDSVFFGTSATLTGPQLAQITFKHINGSGGPTVVGAFQLGTGEVVPVPEPTNVAMGCFGAVFAGACLARYLTLKATLRCCPRPRQEPLGETGSTG